MTLTRTVRRGALQADLSLQAAPESGCRHSYAEASLKRRLRQIGLATATACATLTACSSHPTTHGRNSPPVIQIGSAISLTGETAEEGLLTEEGYQYCQDVVNAQGGVNVDGKHYDISIIYRDDQSSPTNSASIVQQFNDEGIKFILGPYGSSAMAAVAPIVQRNDQIVADSSGADDAIFDHGYTRIFGVESPASNYAASIVDAIAEDAHPRPKTIAFVSADDNFSQEVARSGSAEATYQGFQVLPLITFSAGSTDLSAVITRLKAEHPDFVIESGHLVEGVALTTQAVPLGLRPEGLGETVAPTDPQFVADIGDLANGVIGSTQWVSNQPGKDPFFGTAQDYAKGFKLRFGFIPDYHPAEATAACLSLIEGIEKAKTLATDRVAAAMAKLNFDSFFGKIEFSSDGQDTNRSMAVIQIQHGRPVTFWPSSLAEGVLQWPASGS